MHETSIINSVFKTLEMEFEQEKFSKIKEIYLKVGILSNIEPRLLHNAFSAYCSSYLQYQKIDLHIESTEIKIKCTNCNHITDVKQYRFLCENCQKPSKNIIQGEEMLIHKVAFDD
ncbi:hydrogenase maturation nickel metallochaperone HypA [Tenacibaculum sp. UWU-22]|uniref:hydrogenase maturation nickel metallochaperone HypA/HybF n=1 Tax=Tenacibaculum sp. UWU-22 TaxID=3234187 RepID=UPI0034DB6F6D